MGSSEVAILRETAQEAGALLLRRDRSHDVAAYAGEATTPADLASEMFIRRQLTEAFPRIAFFGEETGGNASQQGDLFVVDPIDGTGNYLMGDSFWGVSIALIRDGQTSVGVIELPELRASFCAVRARCARTRRCVTKTRRLKGAHIWFDQNWTTVLSGGELPLVRLNSVGALPQIRRCCTASMMWVAAGKIDAFIHTQPKPFDIAAAGLIVEMAGGRVTDLDGRSWHPFSSSIVASNGWVHGELLELLSKT